MHNRDEEKEHAAVLIEWIRKERPIAVGEVQKTKLSAREYSELWSYN